MSNIQFVQCAHFGVTFAFRFDGNKLYLVATFSHKTSIGGGRTNFEHFSRKTGRRLATGRLAWLSSNNAQTEPPYSLEMQTNLSGHNSFKNTAHSIWTALDKLEEQYTIPASRAGWADQVPNDTLFNMVCNQVGMDLHPRNKPKFP